MFRSQYTRKTALGRVCIDVATGSQQLLMWSHVELRMYCRQYTDFVPGVFLIMCNDKHERRS